MRTRAQLEALVKRNAEACEYATSKRCECRCGGQFHGKAHSREWVAAACDAIEAANRAIAAGEFLPLFDDPPNAPAQPGEDS
jgi:hypothetical protein